MAAPLYKYQISKIGRQAPPRPGKPTATRRTATAAAAYRTGTAILDQRTGELHDYTPRSGSVEFAEIVTPPGVPKPDREKLWNAAEAAEKRKDAVVAREVMIALPPGEDEKAKEVRRTLVLAFAAYIAATHGCAVDVAIHTPPKDGDKRNYHAHLLLTTRRIEPDGSLGKKTRELDDYKQGSKATEKMRAKWAELLNAELEKAGEKERVDHRSYARRGLCRVPGVHVGPAGSEERKKYNEAAAKLNAMMADVPPMAEPPPALELWERAAEAAERETQRRIERRAEAQRPASPPAQDNTPLPAEKAGDQDNRPSAFPADGPAMAPTPDKAEIARTRAAHKGKPAPERKFTIGTYTADQLLGSGPSREKKQERAAAAAAEAARLAAEAEAQDNQPDPKPERREPTARQEKPERQEQPAQPQPPALDKEAKAKEPIYKNDPTAPGEGYAARKAARLAAAAAKAEAEAEAPAKTQKEPSAYKAKDHRPPLAEANQAKERQPPKGANRERWEIWQKDLKKNLAAKTATRPQRREGGQGR